MLDMRQVTKVYRTELVETHALRSLDLHVGEGEFVAVTGPSGSGKTTFLNIAGLLETFTDGHFSLDGQDVRGLNDDARSRLRNQKIGFIFQGFNLIPDLNLFDNCDVPLRYRGMPASERKLRIEDALGMVGLGSRIKHYPAELSGGQQQMLAISRALMAKPDLMLLDEPSLGLSPKLTKEIFEIVVRINRERGTTILLVEQNANMALNAADYGYVLENGRIVMEDSCERLREKEDIKEFYLGMKDEGVRGERRWKKKKTWR